MAMPRNIVPVPPPGHKPSTPEALDQMQEPPAPVCQPEPGKLKRNIARLVIFFSALLFIASFVVALRGAGFAGSSTAQAMLFISLLGFVAGYFVSPSKIDTQDGKAITAPSCQHCQTEMELRRWTEKNMGMQTLGVFVFVVAVVLLFAFPIGTILGIVLIVVACQLGHKKVTGWKCPNCGYWFESKLPKRR